MSASGLISRVRCALEGAGVAPGARLVLAVSGGLDSMVLLDVLARLGERLGLRLHVVHVHHGLRGRAADRDAAFVVGQAVRRGLASSVARLVPEERRRGQSVQVWAREARYRCLETVRVRVRASRIFTAHTEDDQAETVLLNLLRGTGPRGLGGIPPARDRILRPLLTVSRAEVEAYAAARHIPFRQDASNASEVYRRNRIRHRLLPVLAKEYNPRIVASLASLAALLREDEAALTAWAARRGARAVRRVGPAVHLDVAALQRAPAAVARRLLQQAFRRGSGGAHDLTRRHLEALARLLVGAGEVRLPGGLRGWRDGAAIRIGPAPARGRTPIAGPGAGEEIQLRTGRWTPWPPLGCAVRVRRIAAAGLAPGPRTGQQEILSPSLLEAPLSLRAWRPGDRFRPLGLPGRKKLQDFFVDAKVPRADRTRIPLVLSGERIAWVVGHRIAEEFRWRGEPGACLAEVRYGED